MGFGNFVNIVGTKGEQKMNQLDDLIAMFLHTRGEPIQVLNKWVQTHDIKLSFEETAKCLQIMKTYSTLPISYTKIIEEGI